jgi:hypothetical protein
MKGLLKTAGVAAVAATLGFAVTASRAAQVIVVIPPDGTTTLADGWAITTPAGISLTVTENGNNLTIEKHAGFTNSNSLGITFDGVHVTGSSTITLTGENLTNESGMSWSGFDDVLNDEVPADPATLTSIFNGGAIGTTYVLSLAGSSGGVVSYTGSQASGATTNWGSYVTGDTSTLGITAAAGGIFTLDEIPIVGGGGVSVPLPSAVWQALVGLGGLALVAFGKKLKATA